jgi:mono/diheme cytochrome c family protein
MQRFWIRIAVGVVSGVLAVGLAACSGGGATAAPAAAGPAGDPVKGQALYGGTCTSCHGPEATGITGLGKDLTTSTFLTEMSDAEMVQFLQTGRPASDPLNTTGIDMPPRGGNPALSDQDLADIISYLRSIHK